MRILQVCSTYGSHIGGVEQHVKNISEKLAKKHDLTVFATDPSGHLSKEIVIKDVKIKRFRSFTPSNAYFFSESLRRYLMKCSSNYDIIHAHNYHALPALYAAYAHTRQNKSALIFTPHYLGRGQTFFRNLLHIPYKFIGQKIFNFSDKIICVSKYEKGLLKKNFKLKDENIVVIPNGVNVNELSMYKWTPKPFRPRIIYSGRLEKYQKNLDKLIQSFAILTREYHIDAELVIIGTGTYEKDMKREIDKLRLKNRVKTKNWLPRDKYLEELVSSNIFVMPSEHECYGIAAAEAIVLGVPTVVANSTALSEFVEKGLALGIDTPITPNRIVKALYTALSSPQNMTRKRASLRREILSWDDVSRLLERLYSEVLEKEAKHTV